MNVVKRFLAFWGKLQSIGEDLSLAKTPVAQTFLLDPSDAIQAAEDFASEASYSQESGWAREGWKPCGGYYVGGECGALAPRKKEKKKRKSWQHRVCTGLPIFPVLGALKHHLLGRFKGFLDGVM